MLALCRVVTNSVFSFVMASRNKKHVCHIRVSCYSCQKQTLCICQNQHFKPWVAVEARWLHSMLMVTGSIPCRICTDFYCARGAHGVLPMRVGVTASQLDMPSLTPIIVRSWMCPTATGSCPLGYFSIIAASSL